MYNLGRLHTLFVLILVGLFGIEVTSTQEGEFLEHLSF